jgi:hypothetical protein
MRALIILLFTSVAACRPSDNTAGAGRNAADPPRADSATHAGGASAATARHGTFQRAAGQSAEAFVAGLGPAGSELTDSVVETDVWKLGRPAIIAFYRHDVTPPATTGPTFQAGGYAFLPESTDGYRRVLVGEIEHDGGEPQIRSVFFANADGDADPELVVIAVWEVMNPLTDGTIYQTFVYDRPTSAAADSFRYLGEVSEKASGGCDCEWHEEHRSRVAPYKSEADVRARLRALGYR